MEWWKWLLIVWALGSVGVVLAIMRSARVRREREAREQAEIERERAAREAREARLRRERLATRPAAKPSGGGGISGSRPSTVTSRTKKGSPTRTVRERDDFVDAGPVFMGMVGSDVQPDVQRVSEGREFSDVRPEPGGYAGGGTFTPDPSPSPSSGGGGWSSSDSSSSSSGSDSSSSSSSSGSDGGGGGGGGE